MAERMVETDVLIVGGGGAGFRAAIGAREKGTSALLLSKGPLGRCGATPMAGADFTLDGKSLRAIGFFGEPRDTKEKFFSDIVHQGFYLNNQKLVEQYIGAASDRLKELLDWGIKVILSEERAIVTSGIGIMDALTGRAREAGVDTMEDIMLLDLVTDDGRVTGALGLDIRKGEFVHFKTKAVVLATGGWHKAFWPNTGSRDLSGEGLAMAYRAGADLGNMEFITFCCNVLLNPPVWRGSIFTYVLGMIAGGELVNSEGEAFLEKYDPYLVHKGTTMEWNKCVISFATMQEVRAGKGSPDLGVYYGLGDVPWEKVNAMATMVFPGWKSKGADFTELGRMLKDGEPVEVGPAVEYFEGGVLINEHFETTLEGLYGAGECTLGLFGANRIAAAITEMLVHGAAAGWEAGNYADQSNGVEPDRERLRVLEEKAMEPLSRNGGLRPAEVRRRVQEMAHKSLGPIRNKNELEGFIDFLENVKNDELPQLFTSSKSRTYNKEWIDTMELPNLLLLLETSAKSALVRTESRGVHFREDYPNTDNDNWLLESVARKAEGGPVISHRPAVFTSLTPPGGNWPYLEMVKKMMEAHSDVGGHH